MKRLLDLLKNPRGAWLIVAWLLGIGAAAASIAVVVLGAEGGWVYAVYLAAAVLLAYAIYALVRFVPRATAAVSSFVKKYPLLGKWLGTYEARTLLFAACSFVINVGYVVLNIVMAALMSSIWYAALAAYYFALGALRYAVLFGTRKAKKNAQTERGLAAEKLRIYRNCGIALLIIEGVFMFAVAQFVLSGGGSIAELAAQNMRTYTMITMISSAAFTFYKMTLSIVNLVKVHKMTLSIVNLVKVHKMTDPELWALRNINLAAALVSLLALQTTMTLFLSQPLTREMSVFNGIVGLVVVLIVAGLGIVMIIRANKKKKLLAAQEPPRAGSERKE